MNIHKVRRILKAQWGLQTPPLLNNSMQWNNGLYLFTNPYLDKIISSLIGNPFMKSNGTPTEGKFTTVIDDKSIGQSLLLPPTVNSGKPVTLLDVGSPTPVGTNPTMWSKARAYVKLNPLIVGLGIDFIDRTLFLNDYDGKYGMWKQAGDQIFDTASSALMTVNPLLGTAVKAGGLLSDAMSKYLGVGTDNLTKTDAILGSKLMSLTPLGLANNIFTKRTDRVRYDQGALDRRGGAYTGSINKIDRAKEISNKEVGLFSSTKGLNRLIRRASNEAGIIANIDKEATDRENLASNMSDLNHIRYGINLNGGYDLRYIRAAKIGGTLKRVKKINFNKKGGEIKGAIDLDWTPEIINPVKEFKKGGEITDEDRIEILKDIIRFGIKEGYLDKDKFEPDILEPIEKELKPEVTIFLKGGIAEWNFDTWFNSIPKEYRANLYDYKLAFKIFSKEELRKHAKDPENNHLRSVSDKADDKGRYPFLKLGKLEENPELLGEFDWYNKKSNEEYSLEDLDFINNHTIEYDGDRYYYIPKKFKEGGKSYYFEDAPLYKEYELRLKETLKNVIPDGALHARKHNMENADNLTKKGIPVVDNEGNLQAEIEREEIVLTLQLTKKMEELYNLYNEDISLAKKDEIAIEAGKILVHEILFNTEDRTSLIKRTLI